MNMKERLKSAKIEVAGAKVALRTAKAEYRKANKEFLEDPSQETKKNLNSFITGFVKADTALSRLTAKLDKLQEPK